MKKTFEIAFTTFIVAMIVLPIPPSTIIGVALATHPKTGRYMNQRAFRIVQAGVRGAKATIVVPAKHLAVARERSAKQRIEAGIVRL